MPTSTRPVAFTPFAACALFVSACGGGDDDAATSTAPELTGRQGQCGVHYPVVPAGKTFELNYQTDKDGQRAAMAASMALQFDAATGLYTVATSTMS